MAPGSKTEGLSAYERSRLETIARNTAKLGELGLLNSQLGGAPPARRPPAPKRARPPADAVARAPTAPTRRSERALGMQQVAESARADRSATADDTDASRAQPRGSAPRDRGEPSIAGLRASPAVERDAPTAGSSRSEKASVEALAQLGVGKEIPGPPTKASVMAFASDGRQCPKFSKCVRARRSLAARARPSRHSRADACGSALRYSGSIEWKNAIFLFVNVGGTDYSNLFTDGGKRMSWFAGGRQDETTPLIRLLLGPKSPPRLLFCRLVGQGGPPSPYVYCGRVDYVRHYPRTSPLEVEWELADSGALRDSEAFQALLAAAPK
jgi:hypothetical protein